jgi:hypothetical protein
MACTNFQLAKIIIIIIKIKKTNKQTNKETELKEFFIMCTNFYFFSRENTKGVAYVSY